MQLLEHLKTIRQHRALVRKSCFRLGLYWQGLTHDLSKYSPTELFPSIKYYQGVRSPNDAQRLAEGYSSSWLHHKGRNRHHFEYWTDYSTIPGQGVVGVEMPLKYVAEMFCDRIAACKVYHKDNYRDADAHAYLCRSKPTSLFHPATYALIEEMTRVLAEEGEEAAYAHIRKLLAEEKQLPRSAVE